jgi:hypothetical protein
MDLTRKLIRNYLNVKSIKDLKCAGDIRCIANANMGKRIVISEEDELEDFIFNKIIKSIDDIDLTYNVNTLKQDFNWLVGINTIYGKIVYIHDNYPVLYITLKDYNKIIK